MISTAEGTARVGVVDLRSAAADTDGVAGGALVIDRADMLVDHASAYEALIRAKRVTGVVCLVIGEATSTTAPSSILSIPYVLRHATVLWIGDTRGVRWALGAERVVPIPATDPETLDQLIETLCVPEVFDRLRSADLDVHGPVSSPGLDVFGSGVDTVELAEARAAAVELLTSPLHSRPPGEDALGAILRAGGAADVAPAPIIGTSRLGQASQGAGKALDRVDSLARVLGTPQAVIGRERPTEDLGAWVTEAGRAAENYRRGLVMLLDRMDGHLLVSDPPPDKVVELGVEPPLEARPVETTAGLREFVTARLQSGGSLPVLATELREAATRAAPQGCTGVLEQMRASPQLALAMPRFRAFPLALWTIVLAVLTCAVVGFALGPGWPGRIAAFALASAWAGSGWLLLARRPGDETEFGLRAASKVALPLYGIPALLGGAAGIVAAFLVPGVFRPSPLTLQIGVLASVLILLVTPVLCWRAAVKRWRRALGVDELRGTVAQLGEDTQGVIKREWQLVERRRAVALSLEVVAAGLEEIATTLRSDGDRLFVPERPPTGTDVPIGLARAVPPELLDVVRTDLAGIALQSLAQAWIAAESGRRASGGVHQRTLDRLLADYAEHVREQGLITPRPDQPFDNGPRDRLIKRIWTESPPAQAALASGADDVMTQFCTDDQLGFLSTTTEPIVIRFAPQQVRRMLELSNASSALLADSGIVWSAGQELIGSLRLLPVRLDSVEMVHPGGAA